MGQTPCQSCLCASLWGGASVSLATSRACAHFPLIGLNAAQGGCSAVEFPQLRFVRSDGGGVKYTVLETTLVKKKLLGAGS